MSTDIDRDVHECFTSTIRISDSNLKLLSHQQKKEEGLEEELASNSKDGYLGKMAFLSRVEQKEHHLYVNNKRKR